jgi:hypothetical protein
MKWPYGHSFGDLQKEQSYDGPPPTSIHLCSIRSSLITSTCRENLDDEEKVKILETDARMIHDGIHDEGS